MSQAVKEAVGRGWYARWMNGWEDRLASADTNRAAGPLEWGLEWLGLSGVNGDARQAMEDFAARAIHRSEEFFRAEAPQHWTLRDGVLEFPTQLESPYRENNTVVGRYFPSPRSRGRAVLVLPQWNAGADGHLGLCRLLNRFGISALRMSLAYHDRRKPAHLARAEYHVSSNLGRTIQAMRQSVVDARACLHWLRGEGYQRLAVLGTSLGSCVAFLAAAHEPELCAGVFNHVSLNFGDVVWTGVSTRHVQAPLAAELTQQQLRRLWMVISPEAYLERMRGREFRSLLIWAPYDTSFLPQYSLAVLETYRRLGMPHEVVRIPCGHYTMGRFPFAWWDGLAMCRFLTKWL